MTRSQNECKDSYRDHKLTRAFCFGDERQHITDAQPIARSRNKFLMRSSNAYARDFPSMIKAKASDFDLAT